METRSSLTSSCKKKSLHQPLLFWREVLRREDVGRLGLVGVLEGEPDLVDRALQALHVDRTQAVLLHVRGDEVLLQRELEALELDVALRDRVPLHHRVDREA